ncbi:Rpn family recombination-promoting nuclease/putative transposase [Pedobacter sp. GR22-6]|uniref:Rpn family recombination-promoting nuclease/putative transposase n=1 Tax=Pedobacter sp. GR22-6 TaxID=3127957 RepID=UPI00307D3337
MKEWNYDLKEVYLIAILEDFDIDPSDKEYLFDVCFYRPDTGKIFYDKLRHTYIQLRNFVKTGKDLDSDLDKWLHVLKYITQMDKMPAYLRKPIFKKMFDIAEYSNLTKEERMKYDASVKQKWDNYSALETAKQDGKIEGKLEIARKMKADGQPLELIVKFTELSAEEIEKL